MHRDGTDAARIARDLYGLAGELVPLAGERDDNFRLTTPEGERFVLKLHHEGADPRELALQDAALAHIGGRVPAPRVLGRPGGQAVETAAGRRTVRLLSWIEGRPWAEFEPTQERLAGLGRHVAALDRALADFRHEAMARPLLWNLTAAPEVAKLAPQVSAELRPLVDAVFTRYADFVAPRLEALPHQVVHNDANEHNVLVDESGAVAGLIDFGDVVWSAARVRPGGRVRLRAAGRRGSRALRPPARPRLRRGRPAGARRAGGAVRPHPHAPGGQRLHGRAPARALAGERLPAGQPARRRRRAPAPGGRRRRPRALPPARRGGLRGEPLGARRARTSSPVRSPPPCSTPTSRSPRRSRWT